MTAAKKVLLVEDDDFTRFMMKEIIRTIGIPVEVVENGLEACEQLNQFPDEFGLVLMDIHMPHMSGVAATSVIRSSQDDPPRNVAIIAVTADEQYHDSKLIADHGMDGYLSKPITAGELRGLMEQYCVPS